jgi:site-specific DNA-methyltransferase (adenine-specific)
MSDYIIQGDCTKILRELETGSVSLIFADPPFNLDKQYKSYDDDLDDVNYMHWCYEWIHESIRVLKSGGSLFLHNIPKWLVQYSCLIEEFMEFRHWIVWDAPTSPMGNSLQPAHYGILYYVKPKVEDKTFHEIRLTHKRCRECKALHADYGGKKETIPPIGPLVSDVWKDIHRIKHSKFRNEGHPCQLPVHLLERIILMASESGDLVIDPFMGTGTTAVAAKRLERKFFGIEKDKSYVQISRDRVDRQTTPSTLNGIQLSCFKGDIVSVRDDDIYDQKTKTFKDAWKQLFVSFPETGEDRKKLNKNPLQIKPEFRILMQQLQNQLNESQSECAERDTPDAMVDTGISS